MPALFDARAWPDLGDSLEGRLAAVKNMARNFTAIAWLFDPEAPPQKEFLRSIRDPAHRLLLPYELFTDEVEALEFLREFLSDG